MSFLLLAAAAIAYFASKASAARGDAGPDQFEARQAYMDAAFLLGTALAFFLSSIGLLIVRVLS